MELRVLTDTDGSLKFYQHKKVINNGQGYSVVYLYYISQDEEDIVTEIRVGSRFRKFNTIVKKYFKDCPDLVSKIWEHYFGKKVTDVEKMVNYYNQQCN